MAKTPTPKTPKSSGKKAVPKRAVAKKATARKGKVNKAKVNQDRLRQDIQYYKSQSPTIEVLTRTRPNRKHPHGVTYASLTYDEGHDVYYSEDRSIRVSKAEYNRTPTRTNVVNPYAVPVYTPIHNKQGRITGFRNTRNGDLVTPYYKYNIFNKYFNKVLKEGEDFEDEEQRIRAAAYVAAQERQRYAKQSRGTDLITSYKSLHPTMTRSQIRSDPDFQNLVQQLELFHAKAYMNITPANRAILEKTYGESLEQMNDQAFAQVLVLLGRRLPSDTQPPGMSDPNHIKNVVRPALESLLNPNNVNIELEE